LLDDFSPKNIHIIQAKAVQFHAFIASPDGHLVGTKLFGDEVLPLPELMVWTEEQKKKNIEYLSNQNLLSLFGKNGSIILKHANGLAGIIRISDIQNDVWDVRVRVSDVLLHYKNAYCLVQDGWGAIE
jgi:hypothetical protein